MSTEHDRLFSDTPAGLSDEMLLRRYRAAKAVAEVIGEDVGSLLHDWYPAHISRFGEMLLEEKTDFSKVAPKAMSDCPICRLAIPTGYRECPDCNSDCKVEGKCYFCGEGFEEGEDRHTPNENELAECHERCCDDPGCTISYGGSFRQQH